MIMDLESTSRGCLGRTSIIGVKLFAFFSTADRILASSKHALFAYGFTR